MEAVTSDFEFNLGFATPTAPVGFRICAGVMTRYPWAMKSFCSLLGFCLLSFLVSCTHLPEGYSPREGDLVFQSFPPNPLTDAIEGCQGSPLSHCGIVASSGTTRKGQTRWVVIEAVGPVKETPLAGWISRGRGNRVAVYRFNDAQLAARTPEVIAAARNYLGRPYDLRYRWDDESLYCSELLYKATRDATGKELGKLDRLGDLDWKSHELTIRALEGGDPPLDRKMITPVALTRAPEVKLVFLSGYTRKDGEIREE